MDTNMRTIYHMFYALDLENERGHLSDVVKQKVRDVKDNINKAIGFFYVYNSPSNDIVPIDEHLCYELLKILDECNISLYKNRSNRDALFDVEFQNVNINEEYDYWVRR